MSNLAKPTAEEARAAYRSLRQNQPKADPAKPVFHVDNPLLPDNPDDETDQLPLRFHGRILKIQVNQFDTDPGVEQGLVQLLWNGAEVGTPVMFTTPIDPGDFPFDLELPANYTVNPGRYNLAYVVNIGGNIQNSESQSVNIDTMAPNGNGPGAMVTVPAAVDSDGITREYLDNNGGIITVTVPEYGDAKTGDLIRFYYGASIPTAVLFATVERPDTNTAATAELTEAHIGTGEGLHSIYYTLMDRVGNLGPDSEYKQLEVTLTPAPSNLQPPTVPENADGLVDLADVYSDGGVGVQIDDYDHHVATDKVVVSWEGIAQPPVDVVGFPTFVTVPYSDVVGTTGTGLKTSHITYEIVRGTRRYLEPTGVNAEVDLRKPGPDNPDIPPGPVNPALVPVTVQGKNTVEPNKLTSADINEDATASVPIYTPRVAGEIMQLYWKGVPVTGAGGTYTVTGLEADDDPVDFIIPWADIDSGGNSNELPVHYTVAHSVNDNVDTSPAQPVEVSVIAITVPDPVFTRLDPAFGNLNCNSLVEHPVIGWSAQVRVPGGKPQLADQVLNFTYQGWTDSAGTIPKADTKHTFTYKPTPEEAATGFTVNVVYDPPLLTTLAAWGSIEYTAVIDGFPATSQRHLVRVYMALTGGATCQLLS